MLANTLRNIIETYFCNHSLDISIKINNGKDSKQVKCRAIWHISYKFLLQKGAHRKRMAACMQKYNRYLTNNANHQTSHKVTIQLVILSTPRHLTTFALRYLDWNTPTISFSFRHFLRRYTNPWLILTNKAQQTICSILRQQSQEKISSIDWVSNCAMYIECIGDLLSSSIWTCGQTLSTGNPPVTRPSMTWNMINRSNEL